MKAFTPANKIYIQLQILENHLLDVGLHVLCLNSMKKASNARAETTNPSTCGRSAN